jgi:hypothetical protein
MPGDLCKRMRVSCIRLCVLGWVFTVVAGVEAQTVTLKAAVSETVALSMAPNSVQGDVDAGVASSRNTVRMALSGNGDRTIRVPLTVRSNTSFRISGSFESTTAQLTNLSVLNVRATGRLVSPAAIDNLESPWFDVRGSGRNVSPGELDVPGPFFVLSGPRISLGGTLTSPNNALEVTLLIRVKSQSVGAWLGHLTFFND